MKLLPEVQRNSIIYAEGDYMRNNNAKQIAIGGLMAAMAVVIMSLGGMIPVATYVCCVLCMVLCQIVLKLCGKRIAWAWYVAVSIMGILFGSDKEAAALYCFVGYYPILKVWFEKFRLGYLLKLVYFNLSVLVSYWILISLLGINEIAAEFSGFGRIMMAIMLLLGNITFILTDRVLTMIRKKR